MITVYYLAKDIIKEKLIEKFLERLKTRRKTVNQYRRINEHTDWRDDRRTSQEIT